MAYKKYYKKKNKKKSPGKKGTLNAKQKKEIDQRIDRKLDKAVEDKFLRDSLFTEHKDQFNQSANCLILDISPTINQGIAQAQRLGDKVYIKYLNMFLRYRPDGVTSSFENYTDDHTPDWTICPYPQSPDARVFVLRFTRDLYEGWDAGGQALMERLKAHPKLRPAGAWPQDYDQSGGQEFIKGVKVLGNCVLKSKFRSSALIAPRLLTTGTFDEVTGAIGLATDEQRTLLINSASLLTYKRLHIPIKQKLIIRSSGSNNPINYVFMLYVQFSNRYNNSTYNPVTKPDEFSIRNLWVYEDA